MPRWWDGCGHLWGHRGDKNIPNCPTTRIPIASAEQVLLAKNFAHRVIQAPKERRREGGDFLPAPDELLMQARKGQAAGLLDDGKGGGAVMTSDQINVLTGACTKGDGAKQH